MKRNHIQNRTDKTVQRRAVRFPTADDALGAGDAGLPNERVDILFVNPPAPDGAIWIRSQHRVGRRSREGMIWPQVGLAQMAALFPDYRVDIIDAIPARMGWDSFEALLREERPRMYVTQVTAPTLQNDMYGVFLARSLGATTVAFGTHVTPLPRATMEAYPALDFVLRGEPELTLRELIDTLERKMDDGRWTTDRQGVEPARVWPNVEPEFAQRLHKLFTDADPDWQPPSPHPEPASDVQPSTFNLEPATDVQPSTFNVQPSTHFQPSTFNLQLSTLRGLVWRRGSDIVINPDRPLIADLDDLPLPRHDLLPLEDYRAPLVGGPYAFVVTSRGCPGGCRFCIKHVSYGKAVRFRSPASVLEEIEALVALGVGNIHMYADLFTVDRDHVMGICREIIDRGLDLRWTCNSRVDFVDAEMLATMARAGCWMIAWGIESGDPGMLRRMRKGTDIDQIRRALRWARDAGVKNWGYFIIGLPGETEETIQRTIDLARELPLDLALFHIAAPHPGTPFFFEVVEHSWFRPGTRWEQVDMDRSTVLDYPNLSAEELERWAQRAFRQWALRPGPLWTYVKMLVANPSLWGPAVEIGLESVGWARAR